MPSTDPLVSEVGVESAEGLSTQSFGDKVVIDFWSDLGCPWASLAVHRFRSARKELGLDEVFVLRHRVFPLELVNGRGTPKDTLDAERDVLLGLQSDLGWQPWTRNEWLYPGSTLIAAEAVLAAQHVDVGGLRASEDLDASLRHAFYADSRPIGLHTEIIRIAAECANVDTTALVSHLEAGTFRSQVFSDARSWRENKVQGSPHLVFPDGSALHNPGIAIRWFQDDSEAWHLEVLKDDPEFYHRRLYDWAITH